MMIEFYSIKYSFPLFKVFFCKSTKFFMKNVDSEYEQQLKIQSWSSQADTLHLV